MDSSDNSHLIVIPAGTILSDSLYSTPLFQGDGHGFAGGEAAAGGEGAEVIVKLPRTTCLANVLEGECNCNSAAAL